MGRPAQISREKILEAASTLPLDDLSVSAVASRLGVTHGSLYKYFPSRAALVAAVMIDRGERLQVPDPDGTAWQEWVLAAGLRCRDHLKAHLAATGLLGSSGVDVVMRPLMDAFVAVLSAAGFESLAIADAWNLFRGCCLGAAADVRRVEAIVTDPSILQVWAEVTARFTQSARPATLQWMADIAEQLDLDASFERQLQMLVTAWQLSAA